MIKVGIFGVGNVGSSLISQIKNEKNIQIKGIFSRARKDFSHQWYDDWEKLVDDCDVVIELIGGIKIAKEIIFYALSKNKKVVTANKYFIAEYGREIFPKYQNLIKFEASVCSVLPVIEVVKYLKSSKISEISGVLNGTSNYILSQTSQGTSFEDALKKAQDLGYAESDPTFDIEGIDALQKAQILHFLAFDFWTDNFKISKIKDAKKGQKSVALVKNDKIIIENKFDENFSSVNDNYNGINVKTDLAGNIFLKGAGAGGSETAYAVFQDLIKFYNLIKK